MNCFYEVQGYCTLLHANPSQRSESLSDIIENTICHLKMSKIDMGDTFFICCWLQDADGFSTGKWFHAYDFVLMEKSMW